jgi:hypothetical protein
MKKTCGGLSQAIKLTGWIDVTLFYTLAAITHVLAGSAWLGSMIYSLFVLHPQARRYFRTEAAFEELITAVSGGARGKVLLAFAVIAASGVALTVVRWPQPDSGLWFALLAIKVALFIGALWLFIHTSWRLWPARLFAAPADVPRFQRLFRRVGFTMVALATVSMIVGVLLQEEGQGAPSGRKSPSSGATGHKAAGSP